MITVQESTTKTISLKAMAVIVISNGAGTAALSFDGTTVAAAHTGTKTYGPYPNPGKFTIAATSGQVEYRVDTARNTNPAQASMVGPAANLDKLNGDWPAVVNTGKEALVGTAPPYVRYVSNGSAWVIASGIEDGKLPLLREFKNSKWGLDEISQGALDKSGYSSVNSSSGISGASFDLIPDTGVDLTVQLQAALTAARLAGKPVVIQPGKYIYSGLINNAGGGLVCNDGWAWFDNQDPAYTNLRIDFASTDASWMYDIEVRGIKFTCSTRPDSGLANGAGEATGFLRFYKCRNVKVWGNKFKHSWGGCVLFRDVQDSSIIGNEAEDMWKDCFHVTGDTSGSYNILRAYNTVKGAGDDAFAAVGYVVKGTMPIGVTDIGNRVYGVRTGRAFAYVGCKDIKNIGSIVDGRLPSSIPQQSDTGVAKYNSPCALYIGAEAGFGTYGCENVEVIGLTADHMGPSIDLAGNPVAGIGTYQAIHIAASNGAGNPHKNIKINATVRRSSSRALFVVGNGAVQDIEADIVLEDNTDPDGILSLTGTPGLGNQNAVEFQNVRNIKLKLRGNKIAKGAVWIDSNCTGAADLNVSVGSVSQTTAAQSVITIQSSSKLDSVDFKLNFETTPAASGLGSINRLIDNPNQGITRSVRITGVDNATATANALNGWPMRVLTAGASPTTILNTTGRNMTARVYGGTVSAIARTGIKGRVVAKAVTTGANGTVQVDGDWTDVYAAAAVVTLFSARGVALGVGTVASSSLSGGVTTVTFDATGVNASFAVGMQMGVLNTLKTLQSRTNGVLDLPPETVLQVTYSVTPTLQIGDQSF